MDEKAPELLLPEMNFVQSADWTYTGEYLVDREVKQNGRQPFANYEDARDFAFSWFKQNGVEKGKISFVNADKTDSMGEVYEANPEPAVEDEVIPAEEAAAEADAEAE